MIVFVGWMVELVYTHALGACSARNESSSLSPPTNIVVTFFYCEIQCEVAHMNNILDTTRYVVDHAEHVAICRERIRECSWHVNGDHIPHWMSAAPWDLSHFSEEDKLHFLMIFDALSFCYWGEPKWTIEYTNNRYDGSWGMVIALGRSIQEGSALLNFEYCAQISREDFARILRGNVEISLFEERWRIIREIGKIMTQKYGGKVKNIIAKAGGDAQALVDLVVNDFPSFSDVSRYKGKNVFFHKRAQLLVADISRTCSGQSFSSLQHLDQLSACADYKLPQILRKMGIIEYSTILSETVDQNIEIPHNSREEIEIRASTIWAVEYIKEEVKKQKPNSVSFEVNDYLWLAAQEKCADDKPYHHTKTIAY